jgi:hypothetical protein
MQLGLILEPALLEWAHREIAPLKRNVQRVIRLSRTCRLRATLDAVFKVDGHIEPLEVKVVTERSPYGRHWGESGTDQAPVHVKVQVQAQLMACQAQLGHVLALLPGPRLAHFVIPADRDMQAHIRNLVLEFWKCVEKREPPPDSVPSTAVFHVLERSGDYVEVPESEVLELIRKYEEARLNRRLAEEQEESAKRAIFSRVGAASGLVAHCQGGGQVLLRLIKRTQLRLDSDKVKELIGEEQFLKCKKEVSWYEIKVEG